MASGLQRLVTQHGLTRVLVVSCHSDYVMTALRPDWVFECDRHRFLTFPPRAATEHGVAEPTVPNLIQAKPLDDVLAYVQKHCAHRPAEAPEVLGIPGPLRSRAGDGLELKVRRALPCEWRHFREFHYKDPSLNGMSVCFVGLIAETPVAFCAVQLEPVNFLQKSALANPDDNPAYPDEWKQQDGRRLYREHRAVVLPQAQGIGVASTLCDAIAYFIHKCGADFTSQTVHPHYGSYRDRRPYWEQLRGNRKEEASVNGNLKFSHWFTGPRDAASQLQLQKIRLPDGLELPA
ncbi:unnamed protein product [Symbiodinium natans]|uniref:Uncharacterized protein n=1 Tax=Symbiodinium natans TaxID=878477 RepID=A0A812S230_9DINO|nr:unnamed protein product [Symbiodinium natans]